MRLLPLVACLLIPGLWAHPTPAQDGGGSTPGDAVAAAQDLVRNEKWGAAVSALRAVLADYPSDPRLLPHLGQIERDLQLSRFRSRTRKLRPEDALGPGATKLSTTSWQADFKFDSPTGPLWSSRGGGHGFEPQLIPPISVTMKASGLSDRRRVTSIFFESVARPGEGVLVTPGCYESSGDPNLGTMAPPAVKRDAQIVLVLPGDDVVVKSDFPMAFATFQSKVSVAATDKKVTLKCEGSTLRSDASIGATMLTISAGDAMDIRIKARLRPEWAARRVARAWDVALEAWIAEKYDRAKSLPDWAREALERQEQGIQPGADVDEIGAWLALASGLKPLVRDDEGAMVAAAAEAIPPYSAGLTAAAEQRFGAAEKAFGEALRHDPRLDGALAWRAWVRIQLRRWNGAAEDAAAIGDGVPASLVRARLAVRSGDLTTAAAVLEAAASAGHGGGRSEALLACVRRIQGGHGFERPQGAIEGRYRVIGEVPEARCAELAAALVVAHAHCTALAGPLPADASTCTAYVFSSDDRRKRFSDGLDETYRAGGVAYLADVPTLLIAGDGDETERAEELREITWREHLDRLVASAPAWLAEGGAELLRDGDPGKARPNAALDPRSFVPTAELLRAEAAAFTSGSIVVGQSRELMQFLATHEDAELRALPASVIAALAGGAAWSDVLSEGPLHEVLARAAQAFDAAR